MTTLLKIDDAGFVRAPIELVYRRVTHVGAWPQWWPGLHVRPLPPVDERERFSLGLHRGRLRLLRFCATFSGWRHEQAMLIELSGDLRGNAELWLEPLPGGTIVHHVASVSSDLRFARHTVVGYRRGVRRGLWGLKDALQLEMRTSI